MKTFWIWLLLAAQLPGLAQQKAISWEQFRDSINILEQDSLYAPALRFLKTHGDKFPQKWFDISKEEIFINEKLGRYNDNLAVFHEAHQKGFFYLIHPNLPKYKPYKELAGFSAISGKDLALRDSANAGSTMLHEMAYPKNYREDEARPAIFILHGGGSNLPRVKKHWRSRQLDKRFIKIYVQNYLHYDSETYGWRSGDERAFRYFETLFAEISKTHRLQPDSIYIAGMSAGGTFAIDVAVRQVIPATGFIAFCPGIPRILDEPVEKIGKPNVTGFMLGGENDHYLDRQKQMMTVFNSLKIRCHHEIVKNMGHEYPPGESKWLDDALSFLSASLFTGFWEGPHPEDPQKKFYVHLQVENDSIKAKGYWTNNRFYQESFDVESVKTDASSISFHIPAWNCTYRGTLTGENIIAGGFDCQNEPFDEVQLVKNNEARFYLTEAKPGAGENGFSYRYSKPQKENDKLATAGFRSQNDSLFIHSLVPEIIDGKYGRINSFLLFKDNRLVCEEYFFGYTKNDPHPIESCTKSVTSLLVGIAKNEGYIENLNQTLRMLFPEFSHLKENIYRRITIENLLTMTAGFDPDNDNLFRSGNRIAYALKREVIAPPGETFRYDGGNTEILGAIIRKSTGQFADRFAKEYLFAPLGITSYNWEINKQNGYPDMAGALNLRPRDMGKLGLLVLNHGSFAGKQVVSESWINESTAVKTKTHIPGDDYSYHWWNLSLDSGGKSYECIWANGWGSQFIYIFPALNSVIVTTGHNYEGDSWAITEGISKYLFLLDNQLQ